ncbi:UspA domain-containing protein [Natronococcus amylolyticus DSM 10524]|uniref:UspA domain-containing protein n=1 Tax=Natronococcus amylolyticus DSM 10524 TaxID=1227497 RepID=L9XFS8_9EURY|nr:universal stress protein [Natronococcus amylolyticus]ELY60472.1 UspA domain-containing protein [Natronococcus amylolyticus DSM 10524]
MSGDRLLVPVANPETSDRLLDTAIDLATDRDLEILVLSVVTVPMQVPLGDARHQFDVDDQEALVADAVERATGYGVAAVGRVRFGRSVADGIRGVATDESVDAILLGWRGRPRRRDVVLGSYIDDVLADAPCDVLVKRIDRDRRAVSSVLVPVAGGPNTEFAAETAGALARAHDARIELVTVVPDREEETVAEARDLLNRTAPALGAVESVEQTVLEGSVVETIVERSSEHDVTVVGAAEGAFLRRALVGDVPEAIGREAESAVIMAKRKQDVPEALWRRLRDRFR